MLEFQLNFIANFIESLFYFNLASDSDQLIYPTVNFILLKLKNPKIRLNVIISRQTSKIDMLMIIVCCDF